MKNLVDALASIPKILLKRVARRRQKDIISESFE